MQNGIGLPGALVQHVDRLRRGQDDKVDVAALSLLPDLGHHRQRAVRTGTDDQPPAPPGNVLGDL